MLIHLQIDTPLCSAKHLDKVVNEIKIVLDNNSRSSKKKTKYYYSKFNNRIRAHYNVNTDQFSHIICELNPFHLLVFYFFFQKSYREAQQSSKNSSTTDIESTSAIVTNARQRLSQFNFENIEFHGESMV